MLDEEMDHIIREAAENHHPPYNDEAWDKLELKLDKHLPQKTDRRKLVFFLLFFLLLGGTLFVGVNRFGGNSNPVSEKIPEKKSNDQLTAQSSSQMPETSKDQLTENNTVIGTEEINSVKDNNKNSSSVLNHPDQKGNEKSNNENFNRSNKKITSLNSAKTKVKINNAMPDQGPPADNYAKAYKKFHSGKTAGKTNIVITTAEAENIETENFLANSTGSKNQEDGKKEKTIKTESEKESGKVNKDAKAKDLTLTEEKPLSTSDKKKPKKNIAGNFGLTFSVGPDMSFIKLNKPGKVTLTYGAGLSYSFAKHFTARAGLFFSKKIYVANPDQYHAVTYPNLTTIDANCNILEIPVGLGYNFWQKNKHNWFTGVALSSFIMKKESYNYNYKTATGQTYNYYKEISNENKHYFSVLTVSGGYNYQFNKRVSIQAEPYLKVPLSGVGLGKIKLNSSGILFTLTVKPFTKSK